MDQPRDLLPGMSSQTVNHVIDRQEPTMNNDTSLGQTTRSLAKRTLQRAVWTVGLLLGLLSGTAQAALHFGFSVDFVGGPLDGQTAIGSLTVANADCPGFVCNGSFTPSGPSNAILGPTGTLLGFEIVVDGLTFTAASDELFPDFPIFSFANNVLTEIAFSTALGAPSLSIFANAFGGPLTGGGSYTDANFDTSLIANIQQLAVPLPEPTTALLVGMALVAGLSASRRRRLA
jgi:hypothetical protein